MTNSRRTYTKEQLVQIARNAAREYGVPERLLLAQINQESGWNPNARSSAGAIGIAQIMPRTAKGWGVDPTDPVASINAMAKNMAAYARTYKGDWAKALAAYNAGAGAVAKHKGIPPYKETQNYVASIMKQAGIGNGQITGAAAPPQMIARSSFDTNPAVGPKGAQQLAGNPHLTAQQIQQAYNLAGGQGKVYTDAQLRQQSLQNQADMNAYIQQQQNYLNQMMNDDNQVVMTLKDTQGNDIPVTRAQYREMQRQNVLGQYQALEDKVAKTIDPNSQAYKEAMDTMYGRLSGAYDQYNRALAERYANQGYQLDPATIERNARRQGNADWFAGGVQQPTLNERYKQTMQDLYEAQIANQYGIPYADFVAYKQAQMAAAQKQAETTGTLLGKEMDLRGNLGKSNVDLLGKREDLTKQQLQDIQKDQELRNTLVEKFGVEGAKAFVQTIQETGDVNKAIIDAQVEQANNQRTVAGGVAEAQIKADADIYGTNMGNINNYNTIEGNIRQQQITNEGKILEEQEKQKSPEVASKVARNIAETVSPYGMYNPKAFNATMHYMQPSLRSQLFPQYDADLAAQQAAEQERLQRRASNPTSAGGLFSLFQRRQ